MWIYSSSITVSVRFVFKLQRNFFYFDFLPVLQIILDKGIYH